ncbi:protein AATF-like [Pseudomyrmex gracilis]|uniref:protein AATF-like n=1 Tax=Pseudomyrmex gracilis TaxID=219809 RepID=UPI000995C5D3|nr:protein AATF-like [Pseudomyrmex gracilis]
MEKKMAGKSLADKINDLITTKPDLNSDEEAEETKAKVVERYDENGASDDEFQWSKIRAQNVDTLDTVDERYAGKKVSRKDVYSDEDNDASEDIESEESGEEEEEEKDEDEDEDEEIDSTMEQSETDNDEEADLEEKSEDAEEDMSEEEDDYIDSKQSQSTIKTMSETNVRAEIEKGNCVRNQLKLWENLLEMRIKMQKCVITSNQMPQYNTYKEFKSDMEFSKKVNETKNNLMHTLDKMLQLRDLLLMQYPETNQLCVGSKKRKTDEEENTNTDDPMDEEIPSDTEGEEENGEKSSAGEDAESAEEPVPRKRLKYNDYERVLNENYNSYKEYRDSVIKKWNDKTRIVGSLTKKGSGQTTLKQIEFALSDMAKLRKRSQLKRSEYSIVGKSSPVQDNDGRRFQEYDTEIYDDDDFYHQLLRDLIEYKSSDMTDPIMLSKQWIHLQNMRRRLKRKIDTRATKGRRVRYNVHNKLVNFMAPITIYDTWTDNAKNELYNSLFGKIKPAEEQVNQ